MNGKGRKSTQLAITIATALALGSAIVPAASAKSKSDAIEEKGVMDIASGIYAIRRDPPVKPRRMTIWSDGRIYPVLVIPLETRPRKGLDGKTTEVRHYSIRGIEVPDQRRWKGKLDLWLAKDDAVTPVEILVSRNLADVRMELKESR